MSIKSRLEQWAHEMCMPGMFDPTIWYLGGTVCQRCTRLAIEHREQAEAEREVDMFLNGLDTNKAGDQ